MSNVKMFGGKSLGKDGRFGVGRGGAHWGSDWWLGKT